MVSHVSGKSSSPELYVFGCGSSEGDVIPPHFFEQGLRLNFNDYEKLLERVTAGRPYVWHQDSAPWNTFRKSQKWLSENFYDFTSLNF